MNAETDQANLGIDSPKGRKDKDGTPAVIKTKPLKDGIHDLMNLKAKADAAREKLNSAVKAIAEQSGLLSSVVRKLVNARSGDNFEAKANEIEQLGIVFEEVGEHDKRPLD
jgi:hypothetical protein